MLNLWQHGCALSHATYAWKCVPTWPDHLRVVGNQYKTATRKQHGVPEKQILWLNSANDTEVSNTVGGKMLTYS
jgi:hypothetical protein